MLHAAKQLVILLAVAVATSSADTAPAASAVAGAGAAAVATSNVSTAGSAAGFDMSAIASNGTELGEMTTKDWESMWKHTAEALAPIFAQDAELNDAFKKVDAKMQEAIKNNESGAKIEALLDDFGAMIEKNPKYEALRSKMDAMATNISDSSSFGSALGDGRADPHRKNASANSSANATTPSEAKKKNGANSLSLATAVGAFVIGALVLV